MPGYIKNGNGGYSVDYDDQRFQDVKNEQTQQENQVNNIYDNILNNSDKYYQDQIDAAKEYADKQSELQQAQTDFAIQQIEQQKEQTQKDYTKEQKGAYVDYMKKTKSNAQNMANGGLNNTGYSESSIVSMYNQYQSRVGTARETLNQAILNYNNSIQQATLANNEKLAEIAFNALQTQNQLNQQAFEYKNAIILEKEQALQQVNDRYYARYQDVLNQINNEIELQMAIDQVNREYEQWIKEYTLKVQEYNREHDRWWADFNERHNQAEREYALKVKETNANIARINAEIAESKARTEATKNPYEKAKMESSETFNKFNKIFTELDTTKNNKVQKRYWADLLWSEFEKGKISEDEAKQLANKFNLQ